MNFKYALPITKYSKDEVLRMIEENPDYDFYEIWLSYIKDLDTDFVWKLSEQFNGKLVFLFRKKNLEKSDLESDIKKKIIKLLESSDNFLDLDINDQKEELYLIKKNNLKDKIIVSYHNYKETPELDKIVEGVKKYEPALIKISTFCNDAEDSIKLLTLLLKLKKEDRKFIISGMGEEGKIVRIYGALWGNEMNFAPPVDEEKSAQGQITKKELGEILERIKNAGK